MGAFSSYVQLMEAKQSEGLERKVAVFTFGRFNPPTKGHARLISTVKNLAEASNGDPFIFVSRSSDKDKNPLSFADKRIFMQKFFPEANIIDNEQIKNPFQAVGYLSHLKYTHVTFVVGSDRINEFKQRFSNPEKYFDGFEIVSAGERDPDSDGLIGMSATKARIAAKNNSLGAFRAATGWDGDISLELMRAVQRGMENG